MKNSILCLLFLAMLTTVIAREPKMRWVIPVSTNYIAFKTAYLPDGTRISLTPKNDTIYPGDSVGIQAGQRNYYLRIKNLWGSPQSYVVLTNKGGRAIISNPGQGGGMSIKQSRYVHLTGTGHADFEYGILIDTTGTGGTALSFDELTSDFECDHLEIKGSGFAGIMCKTDPGCGGYATRENFRMENVSLHDNYIHHVAGEGFYIGHSSYNGIRVKCNGEYVVIYPHDIHHIRVFNNIIDHTGLDGIQISCCTSDAEVYNNKISYHGCLDNEYSKHYGMEGIIVGGGSTGKYYNNTITNGFGTGIMVFGLGNIHVYNNIIIKPGRLSTIPVKQNYVYGIFCDDRTTIPGASFNFINNTILGPRTGGIKFMSLISRKNRIYNNVILDPGGKGDYGYWGNNWMKSCIHAYEECDVLKANNFYDTIAYASYNTIPQVPDNDPYFTDAAINDFHLADESPLIDYGISADTVSGFSVDFDNVARPQGITWDAGAYEKVLETEYPEKRININDIPEKQELIEKMGYQPVGQDNRQKLQFYTCNNQLVITSNFSDLCNWELYDLSGRICEKGLMALNFGTNYISFKKHSKAVYFIRLHWGENTTKGKCVL
jgi:hypothetical protein